jgi:thiamine kinase-like enzyme
LLEKRNSKIKPDGTFPKKGELFPSIFSEVFPEKSKELQQALEYLRESQNLIHPDLQWKNILIDDKEQIYLIDFAP